MIISVIRNWRPLIFHKFIYLFIYLLFIIYSFVYSFIFHLFIYVNSAGLVKINPFPSYVGHIWKQLVCMYGAAETIVIVFALVCIYVYIYLNIFQYIVTFYLSNIYVSKSILCEIHFYTVSIYVDVTFPLLLLKASAHVDPPHHCFTVLRNSLQNGLAVMIMIMMIIMIIIIMMMIMIMIMIMIIII